MFNSVLKKVLGTKHDREVKRMQPTVAAISALESDMAKLSDAQLRGKTAEFRQQLDNGAPLDDLLVPAYAVAREASKRVLGMRHYDVQLVGGIVLHQGKIAEMKTGEGKTVVATLACYLNGLERKGVHVVTVNDYLASRDAEWMGKLYGFLGLSTGVVVPGQSNAVKKRAYNCDITYGQNNEFGFDYMRDNMKFSIYDYVQRDLNYAIVDEVDSILIDEARTPLIISGPGETASEKYQLINEVIPRLRQEEHFDLDEKNRSVTLTEDGMERAQELLAGRGLLGGDGNLYDPANLETLHILQQCLRAHALYHRDQHYMVSEDGKVMIIDEFTGRVLPGRRWSDGLHQAVEAKERVLIQSENLTLATISFQNLFRLYKKLSGMTGTADTEATEFHNIYELDVVVIPTNKPIARADDEDLIYKTEREKFRALCEEIEASHKRGQPVLVGTTSVEKSDAVAHFLNRRGVPHNVLNAKQHEREAYVVAQAGTPGAVTVATNMAGRGTDIVLGGNPEMLARFEVLENASEEILADPARRDPAIAKATEHFIAKCKEDAKAVKEAGGLQIIGTERHESRRIDNQLRGRSGRQGDPGASRFFLSLEDDLMRIFAGERVQTMMDRLGMEEDIPIEHRWVTRAVENAQKKVEERNFDVRKNLLEYDDVMNQQRKSMYALRKQVLRGEYRTVPSDEQRKAGVEPEPLVDEIDVALLSRVAKVLENIVKFHSYPLPEAGLSEAELPGHRKRANESDLASLTDVRVEHLEKDLYLWFGCVVPLEEFRNDPLGAYKAVEQAVGMSLSEQKERLLDLVDEIVVTMVDHACPPGKHYEDWELDGLERAFKDQFAIGATGIREISDRDELLRKLYADASAVLDRKEAEFGTENFLRLFRDLYLQEIDKQWMDHLQGMDHLRDGIGLRGYGQRDPKKEYQREGFDMYLEMVQSVKSSVTLAMFTVERAGEEELRQLEEQRRQATEKRQRQIRTSHQAGGEQGASGAQPSGPSRQARRAAARRGRRAGGEAAAPQQPPAQAATVKRDRPKLGRNDPCYCGSGKKYKNCHYREDQAAASPQ
ncbi:MAG: preprotein translocase subunit SecA [Deltaproteobacteria bacterium]|nr:preprotein translocase subunit SecA [Deltaproteobacteria bacterium]NND30526.1 preprotein translocase subunit SecA [Myxococcales bacterium]MBT8465656.1 preprotein translocase subunit SecA [Deltaproteobacteria bacterium]NNK09277.1 preprotein translocase subunit SecA [Myxococcales bacterium]NNK42913.1 preprotein translocase subunit SecA [Myxococcales bacterium]